MEDDKNETDAKETSTTTSIVAAVVDESPRTNESMVAEVASRATGNSKDDDDMDAIVAKKTFAMDQLTTLYGFEWQACRTAVDQVESSSSSCSDTELVELCIQWLLDQGQVDHGGPVAPIDTCPHVLDHVKISLDQLPPIPQQTTCSFSKTQQQQQQIKVDAKQKAQSDKIVPALKSEVELSEQKNEEKDNSCGDGCPSPHQENWVCLECGVIRCSRYVHGHALDHWHQTRDTNTTTEKDNDNDGLTDGIVAYTSVGHCVHVSLTDLSIWCHACQSYIKPSITESLQSIANQLETNKFGTAATTIEMQQ